jgi:RNA ligase (TIGR02306 family)
MENVNSVCFINKILKIEPIEGADKIELVTVNGWKSIVAKGKHFEGELVLCITTDAVIPFDKADKWGITSYLRKGNRVRTVKLRGVYSECILIPIQDIGIKREYLVEYLKEGKDCMSNLGIFKYEPPVKEIQGSNGKKVRYQDNPNFHVYYKFPNAKNVPNMFDPNDVVVVTRKIHGTNARYGIVKKSKLSLWDKIRKFFGNYLVEYTYVYGSHNVEKGSESGGFYSTDVWREMADKYKIQANLWKLVGLIDREQLGSGITVYGEIYGPGIQGEKYHYNLPKINLVLFDVKINDKYLGNFDCKVISNHLDIAYVLEISTGTWRNIEPRIPGFLNCHIEGTNVPHEGIVVKTIDGSRDKICKFINPEYHTFSEKHLVPDSH